MVIYILDALQIGGVRHHGQHFVVQGLTQINHHAGKQPFAIHASPTSFVHSIRI